MDALLTLFRGFEDLILALLISLPRLYAFIASAQILNASAVPKLARNATILSLALPIIPANLGPCPRDRPRPADLRAVLRQGVCRRLRLRLHDRLAVLDGNLRRRPHRQPARRGDRLQHRPPSGPPDVAARQSLLAGLRHLLLFRRRHPHRHRHPLPELSPVAGDEDHSTDLGGFSRPRAGRARLRRAHHVHHGGAGGGDHVPVGIRARARQPLRAADPGVHPRHADQERHRALHPDLLRRHVAAPCRRAAKPVRDLDGPALRNPRRRGEGRLRQWAGTRQHLRAEATREDGHERSVLRRKDGYNQPRKRSATRGRRGRSRAARRW